MEFFKKRALPFLLALALVLSCLPAVAAQGEGSFFLAAVTGEQILIEPEPVAYAAGQTLRQALQNAGYDLEGLDDGFISAVNGVEDSFFLFCDQAGDTLNTPAEQITSVLLTTAQQAWDGETQDLLAALGQFRQLTTGVQNYDPAQAAYQQGLTALQTGALAVQARTALEEAILAYDQLIAGPTAPVEFQITQGGSPVPQAQLTLTGSYGNVYTATGTRLDVIPGTYAYCVSDGGVNRTEGTVEVPAAGAAVALELPSGAWFAGVELLPESGAAQGYESQIVDENHAQFFLSDLVDEQQVFLYARRGEAAEPAARLYRCYTGLDGKDYSGEYRPWNSRAVSMPGLVQAGMEGRSLTLEARYEAAGYTMVQAYGIEIVRKPTLAALTVEQDGVQLPLSFDPAVLSYTVTACQGDLTVAAWAFSQDCSLTVGGRQVSSGAAVRLDSQDFSVTVAHPNGQSQTYQIQVNQAAQVLVTLTCEPGVQVAVYNAAGTEIPSAEGHTYHLIQGQAYTYVTTAGQWYHASAAFTAQGQTIAAATPVRQDWLTELAAANGTTATARRNSPYPLEPAFSPAQHSYDVPVSDCNTRFGLWLSAAQGVTVTAQYTALSNGQNRQVAVPSSQTNGVSLANLVQATGFSNQAVLRASKVEDGVTYYQDYTLRIKRVLHLRALELQQAGELALLSPSFDRDKTSYTVQVPQAAQELTATLRFPQTMTAAAGFGGYTAEAVLGEQAETVQFQNGADISLSLRLESDQPVETLTIRVRHADSAAVETAYEIQIVKLPPVPVSFQVSPADAVVFLQDVKTGSRAWPEASEGQYSLLQGHTYRYTVSLPGYVTQTGVLTAESAQNISVTLEKAPENPAIVQDLPAQWPDFRGNPENNGVTAAPIPIKDDQAVLYWSAKLGNGYSSGAVSSPILVDGWLYAYAGDQLYKLDPHTGEVAAQASMARSSSFAINNPTYGGGMIFVGLSNGGIQAFNAKTLESLWLYNDPLRGQPDCPIVYTGGRVYTGFWKSETGQANFVCLTATDEDPASTMEAKQAAWTYTCTGGFYWAGACIRQDSLLVGTDDGKSGYTTGHASLLSLDPKTGRVRSQLEMPGVGDIRCAIVYDQSTDLYYFTSKGGDFYQVRVDGQGRIQEESLRRLSLGDGVMSTSSPVIYNGRAYVGVSGGGQFTPYSGHCIAVIDLTAWKVAYRAPTQGYPQTSGLLTTAYEDGDGTVYVAFFDNYIPGTLRLLEDRPGQTQASLTTTETYLDGKGVEQTCQAAYALFTPHGAQAEYAICSPVVDSDGTMYFKNDSGCLMALGSAITSLDVTRQPQKTTYQAGERFDPTGMEVTAVFANGVRRDVTKLLTYSQEPLYLEAAEDFELRYEHVMYQNRDGQAGVAYLAPSAYLNLTFTQAPDPVEQTQNLIDAIGAVTESSGPAIQAARNAYDSLTDAQKQQVTNYKLLEQAEAGYQQLLQQQADRAAVQKAEEAIKAIGAVTESSGPAIQNAQQAYEKLTPGQKAMVSNLAVLKAAQQAYAGLTATLPFTDVPSGAWYFPYVRYAYGNGLFNGISQSTFGPNLTMTRAMLVTVLYRMEGQPSVAGVRNPFADVAAKQYYTDAILWASQNGVVNGMSATQFAPNQPITREQMAAILFRYAKLKGFDTTASGDLRQFPDNGKLSGYAKEPMIWAVEKGLITGSADAGVISLQPRSGATRAQVAAILMRFQQGVAVTSD